MLYDDHVVVPMRIFVDWWCDVVAAKYTWIVIQCSLGPSHEYLTLISYRGQWSQISSLTVYYTGKIYLIHDHSTLDNNGGPHRYLTTIDGDSTWPMSSPRCDRASAIKSHIGIIALVTEYRNICKSCRGSFSQRPGQARQVSQDSNSSLVEYFQYFGC